MIYDVLIIGGGASGLFLAANLSGLKVAIVESNGVAGKKIVASGGGRCNITNKNINPKNYHFTDEAGRDLLSGALEALKFSDVLSFFKELKFSEQKSAQFFCDSGGKAVLNALLRRVQDKGTQIFYGCLVTSAHKILDANGKGEAFEILCENGLKFRSRNLVVASGGASYKALGASSVALKIAKDFGLNFSDFAPALVGFTAQKSEFWFKNLSGISLKAQITLPNSAQNFSGDVLFTHKGISGPCILNASLFWQKGAIVINFAPNFDPKILKSKKQISSLLPFPRRFTLEFLREKGLEDKKFDAYSAEERAKILELFCYRFAPAGTFGFERAEVSRGGVSARELDENFAVTSVGGLFFIGEATEITGMLGGYNLHFAFASALKAAQRLNLKS